ncbi:hypothetical protein GQX73_g6717 [Xylaria multiplex]|uniref:Uncharacterized protein n=1 Tax=Xylaria multiplex TaxID=323545 RepID=A0A7C8IPH9_9PEZI|nr:hypothetical protein GQX73_g6717 [Xylaria multiplex]
MLWISALRSIPLLEKATVALTLPRKLTTTRTASMGEIPGLRAAAVRVIMKIPVGEFTAAFAAADTTSTLASSTSPTAAPNSPGALLDHDTAEEC